MPADAVPMTEEGREVLLREASELEKRRPAIRRAIEEARDKGDLRENADYHASREELGMLEARIAQINGLLATAVLVKSSPPPTDAVVLGATVTLRRLKDGQELERTIVGAGQADTASGRILATSPLAKAVLGARAGQRVLAELPVGPTEFEILSIRY